VSEDKVGQLPTIPPITIFPLYEAKTFPASKALPARRFLRLRTLCIMYKCVEAKRSKVGHGSK